MVAVVFQLLSFALLVMAVVGAYRRLRADRGPENMSKSVTAKLEGQGIETRNSVGHGATSENGVQRLQQGTRSTRMGGLFLMPCSSVKAVSIRLRMSTAGPSELSCDSSEA